MNEPTRMKRYECYYTNDLGYDYSAFVRDADEGQFVEYDDLQAWALKLKEVVEGMEHDEECYGGACVICAGREPAHPCGMYFGDNTNHDFVVLPCNCRRGEALRLLGEL